VWQLVDRLPISALVGAVKLWSVPAWHAAGVRRSPKRCRICARMSTRRDGPSGRSPATSRPC